VLVAATSRDAGRANAFLDRLPGSPPSLSCEELVDASDLIVEAATQGLSAWIEHAAAPRRANPHPVGAIQGLGSRPVNRTFTPTS
jgi:hypothetical protein